MLVVKCPLLMNEENMTLNMHGLKEWRSMEDCKSCSHCEGFMNKGTRVRCSAPLPIEVKEIHGNPSSRYDMSKKKEHFGHIVECDQQFSNLKYDIVGESSCQSCEFHQEFRTVTGPNWERKMAICTSPRTWAHTREAESDFEEKKQAYMERLKKRQQQHMEDGVMGKVEVIKSLYKEEVNS